MHNLPKGVLFFDSGIGGLTIMSACKERFPNLPFYYYGDNERAPYGNLPLNRIYEYVTTALKCLPKEKTGAIVLACNTATAVCVQRLRTEWDIPIIGVEPALLPACKRHSSVLVLATRATRQSTRFFALCQKAKSLHPNCEILVPNCDELAGRIEEHVVDPSFDFTPYLPCGKADGVVLGCTHYIYIKEQIQRAYQCPVYDGIEGIVHRLDDVLRHSFFENMKKGRDAQPLITPFEETKGDGNSYPQNYAVFHGNSGAPVFFLGDSRDKNVCVFKHLFAKCTKNDN